MAQSVLATLKFGMPEWPCIVARQVGLDIPLSSGTSTSTSSIAAGHDILGIPGYPVDPKTKARRQQTPSVAQFCMTNQLGIFCILLQSRTGTTESCRLPYLLNTPFTSHFYAPFRTCPSQVGRQYISGSVTVIVIGDLLPVFFLGLEGLCENKATYVPCSEWPSGQGTLLAH